MTLKKTLSFLLALTLVLSILAPCAVLKSSAVTALYGEAELEQVTAPEIGEHRRGNDLFPPRFRYGNGTLFSGNQQKYEPQLGCQGDIGRLHLDPGTRSWLLPAHLHQSFQRQHQQNLLLRCRRQG